MIGLSLSVVMNRGSKYTKRHNQRKKLVISINSNYNGNFFTFSRVTEISNRRQKLNIQVLLNLEQGYSSKSTSSIKNRFKINFKCLDYQKS